MLRVELTGGPHPYSLLIDGDDWSDRVAQDGMAVRFVDGVAKVSLELVNSRVNLELGDVEVELKGTLWERCEKAGLSGSDLETAILAWARNPYGADGARVQTAIEATS